MKGSITATCGHVLRDDEGPDGMGNDIVTADQTREGDDCLAYQTVCDGCFKWYQNSGLIVEDEEEFWRKKRKKDNDKETA